MAPAVKSVCLETRPLVLLLILMSFISDGTSEAISLSCPPLQQDSIVKFDCSVQTSACTYTSVFFEFESEAGIPSTLCQTSFSSPCNQQPAGGMNCGCVSSDSDFKTYQLNFLGDKARHDGGNLICITNCETGSPAVCQPLKFAVTTSHSPSASTSSKTPSTETGDKGSPKKTTNDSYFTTFVDDEASLTFKMNAYPSPKLLRVVYNGSGNNSISQTVEHENTVRSTCSSDTLYNSVITCKVTLLNQTIYITGLYTVTFSNQFGNISFVFEVKVQLQTTTNAMKTTGQSKSEVAGPVAGGVIGALVVIALVVSAVIFIRRKRRKPDERDLPRNQVLTSKTYPERSLETLYDQLQRGDINSPSVYQTLGPRQASSELTDNEDQGRSHVYEVSIDRHENTRGTRQKEIIYQNSIFS